MRPAASPATAPRPCRGSARPSRSGGSTTRRSTWASPPRRAATMRRTSTRPPRSSMAAEDAGAAALSGAVIAFDLDGTLVDTAHDLFGTLNWPLAEEGCAPLAIDDARPFFGLGARWI